MVRWRKTGKPLGVQVGKVPCLTWGIRVCAVGDGLVRDWNELNPSEAVLPSDVIVGINGITDDLQQLEDLINSPVVDELELTVYSWRKFRGEVRLQIREDTEEATSLSQDTTEVTEVTDISEDLDEDAMYLSV
jgi:hypothetical protein